MHEMRDKDASQEIGIIGLKFLQLVVPNLYSSLGLNIQNELRIALVDHRAIV